MEYYCPEHPAEHHFFTGKAVVNQLWEVDKHGDWCDTLETLDVLDGPEDIECGVCGACAIYGEVPSALEQLATAAEPTKKEN